MAHFITHMTALDFWRRVYNLGRSPNGAESSVPFRSVNEQSPPLASVMPSWLDDRFTDLEGGKTHLLVCSPQARRNGKSTICHTWSGDLPEGSFYKLSDEVYISSPEFLFLQLASPLNTAQLVALGYELCGTYSFDPHHERGFRTRKAPLTTIERLSSYLDISSGTKGINRAKQALRLVTKNSASPMESTCHMLMSLPCRLGGYGIKNLLLNEEITLSSPASTIGKRKTCRVDIYPAGSKLDIEYDGGPDHSGKEALDRDRRRTNALISMGFEVIELTYEQVCDWAAFEEIIKRVYATTGKRARGECFGALPARIELRKTLFSWNASYGRYIRQ